MNGECRFPSLPSGCIPTIAGFWVDCDVEGEIFDYWARLSLGDDGSRPPAILSAEVPITDKVNFRVR